MTGTPLENIAVESEITTGGEPCSAGIGTGAGRGQSNPTCTWALSLLSQDFLLHNGRQSRLMTWILGERGQECSELAGAHLKQRSQAYGEAGRAVVFHLHPPSQLELIYKPEMRAEVSR